MAQNNDPLETLFQQADADRMPSDDLMVRVLADAAQVQADLAVAARPVRTAATGRGFGFLQALGGWPGLSGLTAAAITGLMIGTVSPDIVDGVLGGSLTEYGLLDGGSLMPSLDDFIDFQGS